MVQHGSNMKMGKSLRVQQTEQQRKGITLILFMQHQSNWSLFPILETIALDSSALTSTLFDFYLLDHLINIWIYINCWDIKNVRKNSDDYNNSHSLLLFKVENVLTGQQRINCGTSIWCKISCKIDHIVNCDRSSTSSYGYP